MPNEICETLEFNHNGNASMLFGHGDENLSLIGTELDVTLVTRGNCVSICGAPENVDTVCNILNTLYEQIDVEGDITQDDIKAALRLTGMPEDEDSKSLALATWKRTVTARSPGQVKYLQALHNHELTFGIGPAGTGKTWLAVGMAVSMLKRGKVDKIILSRPAVEAGESLGFLPGDLKEKVDPYLRPLYDAMGEMMPADKLAKKIETDIIEVAPLAFMRGRTLSNAFIILDEAQNTTVAQMKMFLTRLGENSRMVITGDMSQIDLPTGITSGLKHSVSILDGVDGVSVNRLTGKDIVRHPLVSRIVRAYEEKGST